jgi:vitamin B12 transporter
MEKHSLPHNRVISFRRWSRKSYAVFSSLGKLIRIGVLAVGFSLLVLPCAAQESRDTLQNRDSFSEKELDEVVVTAQRTPVVQSQLMRVVQVITRAEIEQAPAHDLASLLEATRGVDIRKRGSFGMQADVSLRGGTFDQTLILINGINITDPQTGHHNLNIPVDLQSIERIEVLQGAGARIFGPNAFNGAINIITNQPGNTNGYVSATAGEHGLGSLAAATGFSTGQLHHYVSGQGMKSDGFAPNTDFKTANIFYRGLVPFAGSEFDLQAGYNQKAFGANSFYTPRFPDQFEETRTAFASVQWKPAGTINLKPGIYWRRHHDRFELFRHEAPAWYKNHNYHMTDVAGANINWMHTGRFGKSSAGIDYRMEHIFSNVLGNLLDEPLAVAGYEDAFFTRSYQRSGVSVMAEHSVYLGSFSASAGVLSWYNTDLKEVSFFPGIDLGWQFNPQWRIFGSFSRTLRMPTFTDLFYSGPGNQGNPDLMPEEAISAETGVKGLIYGAQVDASFFYRWGTNMIDWVKAPGDEKWQSMNLTQVNIGGIEAGVNIPLHKIARGSFARSLSVHYGYIRSDKSSGNLVSNYLLDHMRHKFNMSFTHQITAAAGASWRVSWQQRAGSFMLYSNGVFADAQEFYPYWMADVKLWYNLRQFQIFAEASNLLDAGGYGIANVPQPGRWMRAGVTWKWQRSRMDN